MLFLAETVPFDPKRIPTAVPGPEIIVCPPSVRTPRGSLCLIVGYGRSVVHVKEV